MRLGSRFDTRDWKGFRRGLTRFASRADPYSDRRKAMRDYTKLWNEASWFHAVLIPYDENTLAETQRLRDASLGAKESISSNSWRTGWHFLLRRQSTDSLQCCAKRNWELPGSSTFCPSWKDLNKSDSCIKIRWMPSSSPTLGKGREAHPNPLPQNLLFESLLGTDRIHFWIELHQKHHIGIYSGNNSCRVFHLDELHCHSTK